MTTPTDAQVVLRGELARLSAERRPLALASMGRGLSGTEAARLREIDAQIAAVEAAIYAPDLAAMADRVERMEALAVQVRRLVDESYRTVGENYQVEPGDV